MKRRLQLSHDDIISESRKKVYHQETGLLDMPAEVIIIIADYMDLPTIMKMLSTCKSLYYQFVDNPHEFDWILKLKLPYEYLNYIMMLYSHSKIYRQPCNMTFKDMIKTFGFLHSSNNHIVTVKTKRGLRVNRELACSKFVFKYLTSISESILNRTDTSIILDCICDSHDKGTVVRNRMKNMFVDMLHRRIMKVYENTPICLFLSSISLFVDILLKEIKQ